MTNEIVKKEEVRPVKKITNQEVRDIVLASARAQFGVESKIELATIQIPQHRDGKLSLADLSKNLTEVSRALSLESGHALAESVSDDYHGLAIQMKEDFNKEFDCKLSSEKALVDLAVSSYISKLHYTKLLKLNQTNSSSDHTGYRNSASKEIDRAHRQFISAIETLKIMKQPALKVNVRTNNAFIGEKQQFNNNQVQKDENNEAK